MKDRHSAFCRHCAAPLTRDFIHLGNMPPSNAYLTEDSLAKPEITYPLQINVCSACRLVQTRDYAQADTLFTHDYAYFSSTSRSWLAHAENYVEMITQRLKLDSHSQVIEIACNDGYLLKNFVTKNIPCLGIEPTESTASAARNLNIPVMQAFFGEDMAAKLDKADLIIGNNVYAHVPDINDFTRGLREALKPQGVITLEFPHLMKLVEHNQFDTIYHEHYSYLSLHTVSLIMDAAGLSVFDVTELSTHGGSLRIFACHKGADHASSPAVAALCAEEQTRGMHQDSFYVSFQARAEKAKNDFLRFLLQAKHDGKSVAGYGAAAKANTLLNYAGIKPDLLPYICDFAPSKQGKYMPGSHIPILPPHCPDNINIKYPDYLVIFPWNISVEIMAQNTFLAEQGTRFVTAIPSLEVFA